MLKKTKNRVERVDRLDEVNRIAESLVNGSTNGDTPKESVVIKPLRMKEIVIPIVGMTPLMILRFSMKARNQIQQTQEAGSQSKSKKVREPKDFEQNYQDAKYICREADGTEWCGINAAGFRNAMISMCRIGGFVMTRAKLSIFVVADGFDKLDRTPLVRIYGESEMNISPVRNASGVIDLRARALWPEWKCNVRIRFDEDQVSATDVVNLMNRVGQQGGIGEGRPDGRDGNGTGNGLFLVELPS